MILSLYHITQSGMDSGVDRIYLYKLDSVPYTF